MKFSLALGLIGILVLSSCTKKKEVEPEAPADSLAQKEAVHKPQKKMNLIGMSKPVPEPDSTGAIIVKEKVSPVNIMKLTEISNHKEKMAFTRENTNKGKALFLQHCSRCHGVEGRGDGPDERSLAVTPTNFMEAPIRFGKDINSIVYSVTYGRNSEEMPKFRDTLSREDRWTVAYYVEAWIAQNTFK